MLFRSVSANNFRLTGSSPALDYGTTSLNGYSLPAKDLDNNDRIQNDVVDLGAYEFNAPISATFYARASGYWDQQSTWSYSVGGAQADRLPGELDTIIIDGFEVTVRSSTDSGTIELNNQNTGTGLKITSGTLTVHGTVELQKQTGEDTPINLSVTNPGGLVVVQ